VHQASWGTLAARGECAGAGAGVGRAGGREGWRKQPRKRFDGSVDTVNARRVCRTRAGEMRLSTEDSSAPPRRVAPKSEGERAFLECHGAPTSTPRRLSTPRRGRRVPRAEIVGGGGARAGGARVSTRRSTPRSLREVTDGGVHERRSPRDAENLRLRLPVISEMQARFV
jgi:hypothetical protein